MRSVVYGLETLAGACSVPRHRHFDAYATIVLDGKYEQISYAGTQSLEPGNVINPLTSTRLAAIAALRGLHDRRAFAVLRHASRSDSQELVREAAQGALAAYETGRPQKHTKGTL